MEVQEACHAYCAAVVAACRGQGRERLDGTVQDGWVGAVVSVVG